MLKEDAVSGESAEDLGMEREGYEEYGHMVELGDNGKGPAGEEAGQDASVAGVQDAGVAEAQKEEAGSGTSVAVAEQEETDEEKAEEEKPEEFINDPLVKIAGEKPEKTVDSEPSSTEKSEERPAKMVTVPIELTEEEIHNEVPVKIILDIKVHSG